MAGRNGKKKVAAGLGLVGAGASVFFTAAALATGSAAPAKADFEDLLDPIIQPLLTSLTDSIAVVDPAAALDLTSWTDSLLASLGSIDLAMPSVAEPAAALAAASDPVTGTYSIPLTVLEGTEPTVNASIDGGGSVPLLVDTGSSGLVVPYTDLGSNYFSQLESLFSLGFPTGINESSYTGGVDYIYLTYNSVPVDYLGAGGSTALSTDGPVDIEIYSFNPSDFTSYFTNDAFQQFLTNNDVDGILGIGQNTAGPTTSPFIDYGGVYVNVPGQELVVTDTNPIADGTATLGSPVSTVYEYIGSNPSFDGATKVSDNIDSGGVFGTAPSSDVAQSGSVPDGTLITVYNSDGAELYHYTTTGNFDVGTGTPVSDAPTVVSGTSIDSGVVPFLTHGVYIDYPANETYFIGVA